MTYDLFIGDRLFSSWSLRGWLMLKAFGLRCNTHMTGLYTGTFKSDLASLHPARYVPVLRTLGGSVVGESLAIAETLAERHPDAGHWPGDAALRARARWLCAEMTSGFSALRAECPMQLSHVNAGFLPSAEVQADVARIETIWAAARELATEGEWLFGDYCLVDVFYTPVAARIIGYDLAVNSEARDYCMRLISTGPVKAWRALGLEVNYNPFPYPNYPPRTDWPVT
ncbi:MAG: glutathione S-transferase [Pseudomonadota bacterium]